MILYYAAATLVFTIFNFVRIKLLRLHDRGFKNLSFDNTFPNTVYSTVQKIQTKCLSQHDLCNLYIGP